MHCRNRAQCPAYSVQDGYKHARQFHTCISKYLQTLSEGCHSTERTGALTSFKRRHFQFVLLFVLKKPEATGHFPTRYKSVQQCKLTERDPQTVNIEGWSEPISEYLHGESKVLARVTQETGDSELQNRNFDGPKLTKLSLLINDYHHCC